MPTAAEIRAENRRRNEELRRRAEQQQTLTPNPSTGRLPIQSNVVSGANPGGTQTRTQALSDVRTSAAVGGRIGGFSGDPHPETTRLDSLSQSFGAQSFRGRSVLPGEVSGQDKIRKDKILRGEILPTLGESFINTDFAERAGISLPDKPERQEKESNESFQLRLSEWNNARATELFNKFTAQTEAQRFARLGETSGDFTPTDFQDDIDADDPEHEFNIQHKEDLGRLNAEIEAAKQKEIQARLARVSGATPKTRELIEKQVRGQVEKKFKDKLKEEKDLLDLTLKRQKRAFVDREEERRKKTPAQLQADRRAADLSLRTQQLMEANPNFSFSVAEGVAKAQIDREIEHLTGDPDEEDAFNKFRALVDSGETSPDDSIGLALSLNGVNGNFDKARKIMKAYGVSDRSIQEQEKDYRVNVLKMDPLLVEKEQKERTQNEIISRGLQGLNTPQENQNLIADLEITAPEKAFRYKTKLANPEMTGAQLTAKWESEKKKFVSMEKQAVAKGMPMTSIVRQTHPNITVIEVLDGETRDGFALPLSKREQQQLASELILEQAREQAQSKEDNKAIDEIESDLNEVRDNYAPSVFEKALRGISEFFSPPKKKKSSIPSDEELEGLSDEEIDKLLEQNQ